MGDKTMAELSSMESTSEMTVDDNGDLRTEEMPELPQKKYYRQRAHANPMSDHDFDYPVFPEQ